MSRLTEEIAAPAGETLQTTLANAMEMEFRTESDLAAKMGATTFIADPGPAVTALGHIYGIDAQGDAVAIQGKATGVNPNGIGVWGEGPTIGVAGIGGASGAGVSGQGFYGLFGSLGSNKNGAAVYAQGTGGIGVDAFGSVVAVRAQTNDLSGFAVEAAAPNVAVRANGDAVGVYATGVTAVSASADGSTGIGVDAFGAQYGVRGVSTSGIGVRASGVTAVSAESPGSGGIGVVANGATGLLATSTTLSGVGADGHSASGVGVRGVSEIGTGVLGHSELGLGGDFGGKTAPIRLRPAEGTEGPPRTGNHQVGELFVDGKGNLYFCAQPNVWKKIDMA